jgi:hypothetical protein
MLNISRTDACLMVFTDPDSMTNVKVSIVLCDLSHGKVERLAGTARAVQPMDMYGRTRKILRRMLCFAALSFFVTEAWSIETPTLVSPVNNAVGQPVLLTLTWNAVAFADSYRVQISRDSLYGILVMDRSAAGLTMVLQSIQAGPLENDSLFFWHVRARDSTGAVGSWSSSWKFRTVAGRPGVPLLLGPLNAATGVMLNDSLKWKADAVADQYRVQVSSSLSFPAAGTLIDTLVGVSWGNQTQGFRLSGVVNKTKYYWRALSRRGADTSAWSGAWSFTTIVAVPGSPVLSAPAAGATSQPINPTPVSWGAVTDAVTYRLQIATDSLFASLVIQDSTLSAPSKQVSGLVYSARYFWRVNAKNAAGISPYSPAMPFTTKLAPPNPVTPLNGAVNQPVQLVLRWSTVPGAISYRVQGSAVSGFTTFILNETILADSIAVSGLANKTKYYWRVSARAVPGADTSAYPPTPWNYTTIVDTPDVPVHTSPVNGSGSQPVNPTILVWASSTDASAYRLQVATDSLFSALVLDDSSIATATKQVNGLGTSRRYFWRVSGRNIAANSVFSVPWSFSTKPPAPTVVAPPLSAINIPTSVTLCWLGSPEIVEYGIQMSTSMGFTPLFRSDTLRAESLLVGPLANKTKYYWRVLGRNARGDTSTYPSSAWSFTTLVAAPAAPLPATPAQGAGSVPVNPTALSWNASVDATSYRLQITTDSTFSIFVTDDSTLTTTAKQVAGLAYGGRYFWRVSAKNSAGSSPFSVVRSFNTALALPSVIAPATGALDQSVTPLLRWTPVAGTATYLVQVSRNAQLKPLLVQSTGPADSLLLTMPLANDTIHYWRVSARNATGDSSAYPATPWNFRTRIPTPVLSQPSNGATGLPVNPTLSWLPSGGASTYRLQVCDDPGFPGGLFLDDATIISTSRQVGPLTASKTYYWRVNARNANSTSTSLWSGVGNFTTRIDTPATPSLVSPLPGATDVIFTPTLRWNPAPGAAYYGVQVSRDSIFTLIVFERAPLTATSITVDPLQSNTTLYWRVNATNQTGNAISPYTRPWAFTTVLDTPQVPVLWAPLSRARGQSITPTLSWHEAPSAEWYRVQIATDSYFPTVLFDTTRIIETFLFLGPGAGEIPRLQHNTTYFWRVRSINRLDSSSFTMPFHFVTAIDEPGLLAPPQNAVNLPATGVDFAWTAVAGAQSYAFRLSTDSSFRTMVYQDSLLAATSLLVRNLSVSTRYYWQLTAHSDSNGTTHSPIRGFTTVITVPGVPQPLAPVNGSTNTPTAVTFQWQPSLGANSYRLQISTDSTFAGVLFDFPALTGVSQQVQSLAYNTTYFWRVSASNANGPGAPSAVWRCTITVAPPEAPSLISPIDGATNLFLPVVLTWGQTVGATQYRVRLSATPDFSAVVYDTTTSLTSCKAGTFAQAARFYWQVTSMNPGGSQSSAIWTFVTQIALPVQPILVVPLGGAINLPTSVTCQWNSTPGASRYHLQVARDSFFAALIFDDSAITELTRDVKTLDAFTRYFWRVGAVNAGGKGPFSQVWSFRTIIGVPMLVGPEKRVMYQPQASFLRWERVPGAGSYRVQIAYDPVFSAIVLDVYAVPDTMYKTPVLEGFTRYYWRVRAQSADGSSNGDFAEPWYFTTVIDVPVLLGPPDRIIEQPTTVEFRWRPTNHAESYRLEIATDDSFQIQTYGDGTIFDTARVVGPIPGLTQYYWRLRAQNPADTSIYTATRTFHTTIGTPQFLSPADRAVDRPLEVLLSWSPVPGAARYRVQVATDSLFAHPLVDDSLVASAGRSVGPLDRFTRYFWRVRAKTADGISTGAYARTQSFTTVPFASEATSLIAPADGTTNLPSSSLLRWRAASRATSYGLQIAPDSLFANPVINDTTIVDTVYHIDDLAGVTHFFWRVRVINAGGSSPYSPRFSFSTMIGTPVAVSPVDRAFNQSTAIRVIWKRVPFAVTYRIQMSADTLFRSFVLDDSAAVDSSRYVTSLARLTTYYWRVRARASGNISTSPYSPVWQFTTVIDTPGIPVLVSPLHATRNVPITPPLRWRPAVRASRYRVELAGDSLFEFVLLRDSLVTDTTWQSPPLAFFTTYYWRVRSENIGGSSMPSAVRRFLTQLAAPVLVFPAQESVEQPAALTLRWNPVTGATRYRLIVSSDSVLRSPIIDDSTLIGTSRQITGLSYLTTYYWRVLAKTADGLNLGVPSTIWKFTTSMEPPGALLQATPANKTLGFPTNESLVWFTTPRGQWYHLQVATDSLCTQLMLNDSTVNDSTHTVPGLTSQGRYWWRVRALNTGGKGPFSAVWGFTTIIGRPSPTSPADSATGLPVLVTIRWNAVPGATGYTLQVAGDSLFAHPLIHDSTITGITRDVPGLTVFTRYFWRVRALDAGGGGLFSDRHWFMTLLVAPAAPVQSSPLSGVGRLSPEPAFRWRAERLSDRYQLQLALDSPFDSTIYDNAAITDTQWTVTRLRSSTRHFWRVRGWNSEGPGAFSTVWSFTTVVAFPAMPELVAPASASDEQPPYVIFVWKGAANATRYHLQVSMDAPFATTVANDSALTDTVRRVGPLNYRGIYYWRVRATNSEWSTPWSPVWSMSIMPPPAVFDLFQNFPNPVNPVTVLRYDIPVRADVTLTLYNLLGQQVRELVRSEQPAGRYEVEVNMTNLPSGVFMYRLVARSKPGGDTPLPLNGEPFISTRKLLLLK